MSDFRVAILGNGGIYRLAHGPAWAQVPRAKVVATCDIVEDSAKRACRETGAEWHCTGIESLLSKDQIDIVDICTPSDTHADLSIQALQAGKHVICEKPMAVKPADASRMIEASRSSQRQLHIGHTRRFGSRWKAMKEQIRSGRLGDPVAIRRSERSWGGFPRSDWHWDFGRSGGVMMDLGIHIADLFSWFLDAAPLQVYARGLTVRKEAQETGCFDFGLIHMGFEGGKQGLMEVSWTHPKEYAPFYSTTEVIGTLGKMTLSDGDSSPMVVIKEGIGIPRYSPLLSSFPETFVEELNHFLDCIEGKAEPRINTRQAHQAVQVVDAALQSVASGGPITLT
ncbi:MAG: Gfo/Idh/MocA family protein [Candidatus Binatia bacterium]